MDCQRENLLSCNAGIYIHIPFCIQKCPYCDFYSISDLALKQGFVTALIKELKLRSNPALKVDTIYLGGGTPSLLTCEEIDIILEATAKNFSLMKNTQITMEVNPGTIISLEKSPCAIISSNRYLSNIHTLGVNRLSIGAQSFQDAKLHFLKRIHSADAARKIIADARDAGFNDIGIDLIYGVPEESEQSWLDDLDSALQYSPEHLSCYMLSYEPDTPMFDAYRKGLIIPLDEETISSMFRLTSTHLVSRGFCHYEISNFAATSRHQATVQHQSRHNKKYWQMVPYLGFGPSAHSYDGERVRSWNVKNVREYIAILDHEKLPVSEKEVLTHEQRLMEMLMVGLRTDKGIDIYDFEQKSGSKFEIRFEKALDEIGKRGWGEIDNKRFILTLEGRLFMDTITRWFVETMDA
ncbi:MAG: radical SAM family heme chaperone HemW [Desulfamplus sp.]|nr:radical SAM family heme chaperone HemW [Desulfamplus sp.]